MTEHVTARAPEDLTRLTGASDLDEVFGDDAARHAAAERVHAEHSFRARAERLLVAAHEARSVRGLTA